MQFNSVSSVWLKMSSFQEMAQKFSAFSMDIFMPVMGMFDSRLDSSVFTLTVKLVKRHVPS